MQALKYTSREVNRNFRIKVSGLGIHELKGFTGFVGLVGSELANNLLDRAFRSRADKVECKLRRGLKITFYYKLTKLVSTTEQEIAMLDQRLSQLRAEHHAATLAITTAKDVLAIDLETEEEQAKLSPEYRKLTDELTRAQTALEASATTKITAATLTTRRRDISAQIDMVRQNLATATADLRRRLANKERTAEIQRLIDETKAAEKKIAERIAELECLEFAAAAYTKADIEAVEAAINSRFDLVRWRMYEQTIEGADVETCVATIDGVPFNSLNSAGQVLAGLDIIRTFCRYYGATAPVFIDNAESISQTDFALDSQVIRLQVVEGAALELKTA